MPQLDHTGPEGKGPKTGRKLGKCRKTHEEETEYQLGEGMGKKRKDDGCNKKGGRIKSGKQFEK
ncbi:MAG: DUF5320 domain-containing protein [Bacteroidota bacterium]